MSQNVTEHPFVKFWRDENVRNADMGLADVSHGAARAAWEALPYTEQSLYYLPVVKSQEEFFNLFN